MFHGTIGRTTTMSVQGLEAQLASEYAGKPYGGARNAQADFRDEKGNSTLHDHFDRHGEGFASEAIYKEAAVRFLEQPPTPTTQTFTSDEGTYFRYDTATNEFGIINKYGGVSTYYEPPRNIDYWVDQITRYAPKKGR
jgi:pyocin large subunit-like protein